MTSKWAERARSSPYYPALSHPVFRKVLPGTAASALGDGMSAVAIAWLAIELAPPGSRGLWVGAAVAAYSCSAGALRPGWPARPARSAVGRGIGRGVVPGWPIVYVAWRVAGPW